MFERMYRSSMKHGSRILFAITILLVVTGLVGSVLAFGTLGPDNQFRGDWTLIANQMFVTLSSAVMPLIGALLVNRLDRWLAGTPSAVDPD